MKDNSHREFYGVSRTNLVVAGFRLCEFEYAPDVKLPMHSHGRATVCFVLRGSFDEIYKRTTLVCSHSTLLYRPADEIHSDRFHHSGGRCMGIEIEDEQVEHLRSYGIAFGGPARFNGGIPTWLAMRLYKELSSTDRVAGLVIEGIVLEILAEVARHELPRHERKTPPWFHRTIEFLRARFREPLALSEVAGAVGVHPVHLTRVFRQRQRCTVGEYVRRLRVEYACRELSASENPLVDIALAAGFSNQSQFSTSFKRLTGMSPASYRRLSRAR